MAYDASQATTRDQREKYIQRWGALKTERSSWIDHWRELSQYLLPRSGRFLITDRNKGGKRHNSIIDSTGTRAVRTLAAGMMAGMTSPARPWFRLATPDKKLMSYGSVKRWLDDVGQLMRDVFSASNTYRALHGLYTELGCFGTGADILLPNFNTVVNHELMTAGEYALARGRDGKINVLYREFEITVGQMVEDFGLENVSYQVKNLYENRRSLDSWIPVLHVIEPRKEGVANAKNSKQMLFKSCYFELDTNENKVLRESGFRRFPALTPRWDALGGDIYGNSPGMEALGDTKQLQHQQLRKGQAIDYQVKPPLQMPSMLKNQPNATVPGGVAFVDTVGAQNAIQSMFDVNLNLQHLREDLVDVRGRINSTFYVDLFLFMQQLDSASGGQRQITAREIAERHEEKLIMLGPVLERLHDELLKPLIDQTFDLLLAAGALPPPPPELSGQELEVEFVSMLAQAQRAVGIGSVDRLLGTVLGLTNIQIAAQTQPTAADKIDSDKIIDSVSDMLGIDPDLIVADDKVALIRKGRAEAQAAQAKMAAAQQASETAKNLAAAPTDEANALTAVTDRLTGYSTPEAGV